MKCSKCPRYSRSLGRCLDGKANPTVIKNRAGMMKIMGVSYACGIDEENRLLNQKSLLLIKKEQQAMHFIQTIERGAK